MSDTGSRDGDPIPHALEAQRRACESLGSSTAVRIIGALAEDYARKGPTHRLLHHRFDRPVHDAAPLRLLGGLHRLVLGGAAPDLARHFPTAGGQPGRNLEKVAIDAVATHLRILDEDLDQQVQTNEVGRSVVHMALGHWLGRLGHTEFDLLEVGSSAGLNLNFSLYGATTAEGTMGDPASTVTFGPDWFDVPPPLASRAAVPVRIVGSDPHPVDVTTDDGTIRLLSFVWPDQTERFERLRRALHIARTNVPDVRQASAEVAVSQLLPDRSERPTLVFHSITWQYLGSNVQNRFVEAIRRHGRDASRSSPLVWARMEPAGTVADIRATMWQGDSDPTEMFLGTVGYHGKNMRWSERVLLDA